MIRNRAAQKIARRAGILAAFACLALAVVPATGMARASVKFGSKLNPTVQPSNSMPGLACKLPEGVEPDPELAPLCTMVLNEAYGRPDGGERAPRRGIIKEIRLIAGGPGNFRLQLAEVRHSMFGPDRVRVVNDGRRIFYKGQTEANFENDRYRVESFQTNFPVRKGQQLALRGSIAPLVRCSSGGDNTLISSPYLNPDPSGPFVLPTYTDGCWLLMEAVIR